jgi:outer membrane immunogenic protein
MRIVYLLAAVATTIGGAVAVQAQPANSWTGFYAGVNGGGGRINFHRQGFYDTNPVDQKHKATGYFGGGQVGFNYQLSSPLVIGAEADFQVGNMKKFLNCAAGPYSGGSCYDSSSSGELSLNRFGTARARIGYAAGDWLIFGTGGLAYGRVRYSVQDYGNSSTSTYVDNGTGSQSKSRTGWAVGGGAEYRIGRHWSVKGEFLHFDLGSTTMKPAGGDGYPSSMATNDFLVRIKTRGDIGRVGVNFQF